MSEEAKTLMYWIEGWRHTRVADYDNAREFWCARDWAGRIIGAGCWVLRVGPGRIRPAFA